jgi:hypothetical protein
MVLRWSLISPKRNLRHLISSGGASKVISFCFWLNHRPKKENHSYYWHSQNCRLWSLSLWSSYIDGKGRILGKGYGAMGSYLVLSGLRSWDTRLTAFTVLLWITSTQRHVLVIWPCQGQAWSVSSKPEHKPDLDHIFHTIYISTENSSLLMFLSLQSLVGVTFHKHPLLCFLCFALCRVLSKLC